MQRTKRNKNHGTAEGSITKVLTKLQNSRFTLRRDRKVRREIKDRLFCFLFEKDKQTLLELYNALNQTFYQDTSKLQVVTIENAVYVTMQNDLAFVLMGTLSLYEHQSTYNPNMPVRFLIYLAEEYQKLVRLAESSLYGTAQIMLPTPQCVVFYNGEKEVPEEQILRLSDSFENKKREADVELKVRMLNINYGHNEELMQKCRILREYAEFVDILRQCLAEGKDRNAALNKAIDYCIDHDILAEFLRKYRGEVLGMLLEEFDVKKYERTLRREGKEEGRKEGAAENLVSCIENLMAKMNIPLSEACDLLGVTVERYEEAKKWGGI